MKTPRVVTRSGGVSTSAMIAGVATLPEGVSFLAIPKPNGRLVAVGEFPHVAMVNEDDQDCLAALEVRFVGGTGGGMMHSPYCTRAAEHEPPHVAHIAPGSPIAAWTDEP